MRSPGPAAGYIGVPIRTQLARTRTRKAVQIASLLVFATLTVAGLKLHLSWLPEDIFSRLDPLVGLAALVASRTAIAFWLTALLVVALTLAFGRAWCGWICPVGTLLDLIPAAPRARARKLAPAWRLGKYATLVVVIGAAAIGSLGLMVLDPVTIVTRPLQELGRPFAGTDAFGANAGIEFSRYAFRPIALLSLLPLAAVLGLNALARRAWCRTLCPLGGLLALLARVPGVRRVVDSDACTGCARCAASCPTSAIVRGDGFPSDAAECTACMVCVETCPEGAVSFMMAPPPRLLPSYRPDRRQALTAAAATTAALAVASIPRRANAQVLRPPSTDDARLARLCVRCGACYSACPSASLRPSLAFASEAGLWTPMLDERPPHCTLSCNKCADVCPTDALHKLDQWEEIMLGVGTIATVHQSRCRAWNGKACLICRGACPITGAIGQVDVPGRRGGVIGAPVVDLELCIGCNECGRVCPEMPPAIWVDGATLQPRDPQPELPVSPST